MLKPNRIRRIRLSLWFYLGILMGLCSVPAVTWAHAVLLDSTPAPDSVVEEAPTEIRIRFTERIDVGSSEFTVKHEDGTRVDRGTFHGETPQIFSDAVIIPIDPIGPGTYTVEWRVLSIDTHFTVGRLSFTVAGGVSEDEAFEDGAEEAEAVVDEDPAVDETDDEDVGGAGSGATDDPGSDDVSAVADSAEDVSRGTSVWTIVLVGVGLVVVGGAVLRFSGR